MKSVEKLGEQDRRILSKHGTYSYQLKPLDILRTATIDLRNYNHNTALRNLKKEFKKSGASMAAAGSYKPVTILKRHLLRATNEVDVLTNMIKGRVMHISSTHNWQQKLLYADLDTLEEAKRMAEAYYGKTKK